MTIDLRRIAFGRDALAALRPGAVAAALAFVSALSPGTARAQFFTPFWRTAPPPPQQMVPPPPPPGYYVRRPSVNVPRGAGGARPAPRKSRPDSAKASAGKPPAAPAPSPPPAEPPPPPYDPQLMRLSEIMGSLAYLRELCGAHDGDKWRSQMKELLDSEATTDSRREKLAGAFNKGFRIYGISYRVCTPNAEVMIARYLKEGGKIARDVSSRYSGG